MSEGFFPWIVTFVSHPWCTHWELESYVLIYNLLMCKPVDRNVPESCTMYQMNIV